MGVRSRVLCTSPICWVGVFFMFGWPMLIKSCTNRISVSQQAFLDTSSAQNPALSYGAYGILGLVFTSLSTIDALVNMTNSSAGRSLLYNLFLDNPKEPNFIAFSLQRSSDRNNSADGSFSVGGLFELVVDDGTLS
jgi:saccharopepsin